MNIRNAGRQPDRLIGAEMSACAMTQLHETIIDENDVMSMQHVEEISIPAGETVKLEVGGLHVMCMNRQVDMDAGTKIPITLSFAVSGERMVEAEIREG
jgi:copper(I)-binding protein